MTSPLTSIEPDQIRARLAHFRNHPPVNRDVAGDDLKNLLDFLIKNQDSSSLSTHWFCSNADPLVREAATFMIRINAYEHSSVAVWRERLQRCLTGCAECIRGMQERRYTTRNTYWGGFSDEVLDRFHTNLNEKLAKFVVETCKNNHMSSDKPSESGSSLSDIPPALAYLMVSDLTFIRDPSIKGIIRFNLPSSPIQGWPTDAPPLGLLMLLMDETSEVRAWAASQVALCTHRPMLDERFTPSYFRMIQQCMAAIVSPKPPRDAHFLSKDILTLWEGLSAMLRFVPKEWLHPSGKTRVDIRQFVVGHLSDSGPHFTAVLKAFLVVLGRLGPDTWKDEGDEFPEVVLNAIKDNTSYSEMLQTRPADRGRWAIQWMETYVKSIAELPAFSGAMPLILQFLCEELQHERYQDARGTAINVASKLLQSVLFDASTGKDKSSQPLTLVWESLNIHANAFIAVAFGSGYDGDAWKEARESARKLIKASLKSDITNIHLTIAALAGPLSPDTSIPFPSTRPQIWTKMYDAIGPNHTFGMTTILEILPSISHVDNLLERAFSFRKLRDPDEGKKALRAVNSALSSIRSGFSDAVSRYLDFTDSSAVLELLSEPNAARNVMTIMFSPLEILREPAQSIAGAAMDVESRLDCFRALILNFPAAAMNGMIRFLETFIKYAPRVPEACNLSKALALCFTDIIDVLCSNPDGLLHKTNFLQAMGDPGPAVQLPKWWALMSSALSTIFKGTPLWAQYFDNSDMVIWMRDALIFGRDMLAQRRVIESAALALSPQPPTKRHISRIGSKMVDDLQTVLLELARWLRLTDEELLFQAFALLQSLLGCFKETQIDPSETVMAKLKKHVDDAQSKDPKKPQTRLDSSRIRGLRDTLRSFEEVEDDDEVEIVEHFIGSKEGPSKKPVKVGQIKNQTKVIKQQKLTTMMPKSKQIERKQAPSKLGTGLTAGEQRRLESSSTMPKFSRSVMPTPVVPGSSKTASVASSKAQSSEPPSDSSESEEEEGKSAVLRQLHKMQLDKIPTVKKPVERRQVKMLDIPTHGGGARWDRLNRRDGMDDARRTMMRLKPDVSNLHRTLLSWDYAHDGNQPPGRDFQLYRVPDRFNDPQQFQNIFEPLLLMECWAQIQQSKKAGEEAYECNIVGRHYTDAWLDIDGNIAQVVQKDWSLSDTDIVLLRHMTNPKCHLAKVQHFKPTPNGLSLTVRVVLSPSDPGPVAGNVWRLSKVFSLTTLHREYGALKALPYYDMCGTILNPSLQKPPAPTPSDLEKTMKMYRLNEPQSRAILSALATTGFSLVQGPPGTGKTSTICGLVQAFLSKRAKPVTMVVAGRGAAPPEKEIPKKILLCAPSNAAIDEITYRLKEGIGSADQHYITPKVVRVGNPKSMNISVKDVSLDALTDVKLNASSDMKGVSGNISKDIAYIRSQLDSLRQRFSEKENEKNTIHDNTNRTLALEDEIRQLRQQRKSLAHQLDKLRDKQNSDSRAMDAVSRRCRAEVLQEADVICATLAGSGHELLESFDFEMVIIDEAAQAIELSSLIPLKYRSSRCVMVGDPQQLPPTVISMEASNFGYNQSLFVRLQKHRPDAVHLLSIQYRMHPEISILPSQLFYKGRLQDGPDMAAKTQKPWHASIKFGPYRFYNVAKGIEESRRDSYYNRAELDVAVALYNRLRQEFKNYDFDLKVGIVTMYRAQVVELRNAFIKRFGADITASVDFNTVDGFQGQEKEVIILSCVRAGPGLTKVGFLADVRRMNVALTRAKSSVFVLGNAATLERSDENWKAIVTNARERSCLVDADVSFFTTHDVPSAASKAAKPTKAHSRAQPSPALEAAPNGLIALGRGNTSKGTKLASGPSNFARSVIGSSFAVGQPPSPTSLKGEENVVEPPIPVAGQKRPADETPEPPPLPLPRAEGQRHPAISSVPNDPQPPRPKKPKPPLVKKPKGPPNIFLKRPAPPGGEAGPSTNRRKL